MELPKKVLIREVGPRDGLQNEDRYVPAGTKIQLIKALQETGLKAIEITSFVHPRAVPQLKDAEEVCSQLELDNETAWSALVGNAQGVERGLAAGINEMVYVVSASEAHNKRNMGMSVAQSLQQLQKVSQLLRGTGARLRGAVGTTFGCPYQGLITMDEVALVVEEMMQVGIKEITLADTSGLAEPLQVLKVMQELKLLFSEVTWALHFHDTRGTAIANVFAGLQSGVSIFEGSVGGVGGCPFIAGAAGNAATEDMVYMLHRMGISTGIDLDSLVQAARFMEEIVGRRLPGKLIRVGT